MDGRPPGNTGCCRLFFSFLFFFFFFFLPPLSFCAPPPPPPPPPASPTCRWPLAPHRAQSGRLPSSPSRGGWPGPRLPLQTWVASGRPASPSAFGFQETRGPARAGVEGVLSVWGSLGRPQALLGGAPAPAPAAAAAPGPSPAPPLDASSQATAGSPAGARAQHSHTHTHKTVTHTHTHNPTAAEKGQEPETTGKGDGERGRERDRQQEDHTDFQTPGRHTLSPPFWVPPGPQSTRPHRRPPTHSHTHSPALTLWPGGGGWVSP